MYTKTIVCLANSRKKGGRCVAGKVWQDTPPGQWVRPISHRPNHALCASEWSCQDNSTTNLLDIVTIPCVKHAPLPHQPENHLIAPNRRWTKEGRMPWNMIHPYLDNPNTLWALHDSSKSKKYNDRISTQQPCNGTSLYLIAIDQIILDVGPKSDFPDASRAVLGQFTYNEIRYKLDVTDPVIEKAYLNKPNGFYTIHSPTLLCVSLTEEHEGYYYKLIAAILHPDLCL